MCSDKIYRYSFEIKCLVVSLNEHNLRYVRKCKSILDQCVLAFYHHTLFNRNRVRKLVTLDICQANNTIIANRNRFFKTTINKEDRSSVNKYTAT